MVSFVGVLAFDFFFVSPYFSFSVSDTQYILTFLVLLLVGIVVSYLTSRVRRQTEAAKIRERETYALFALGRDLRFLMTLNRTCRSLLKEPGRHSAMMLSLFYRTS